MHLSSSLPTSLCDFLLGSRSSLFSFFFFNDTATTEIYTLSLHDALPICPVRGARCPVQRHRGALPRGPSRRDRKSTRLNSSHQIISYAVFCLKKKKDLPALDDDDIRRVKPKFDKKLFSAIYILTSTAPTT